MNPSDPLQQAGLALPASDALWVLPLFALVAFLLGSIPWGVIVSRLAYGKDIRAEGSGNIGTTNALRTLGKAGGAVVFLLDFGKGVLAGWLGAVVADAFSGAMDAPWLPPTCLAIAFLFAIWGHVFSPWLGFKGGKGIAVAIGTLLFAFGPLGSLAEVGVFAVLVIATRRVSVGSLGAAVACPFLALWLYWGQWGDVAAFLLGAVTVIWAHRGNIGRLVAGTESRIGGAR